MHKGVNTRRCCTISFFLITVSTSIETDYAQGSNQNKVVLATPFINQEPLDQYL